MSGVTTHVLDTARGQPAVGVSVVLSRRDERGLHELSRAETDADGRVREFPAAPALLAGVYQLSFETASYFRGRGQQAFFERAELEFRVTDAAEHYHVPLLLTPFGYTTYRGT